ncbi:MAG: histidine phosphatase family protein, partial [Dethiobacteria bacterium]|nr:histidine phosphatase family protein [Dethiobacteria bacterium]
MDLYLVRHGETESNKQKRYQGWTESPLSTLGIRQAEKAAYFLAAQKIEGLYSSDLKRAANT